MKKRDAGIILGIFFVLMAVYFPITAFVFNGGFTSAIGIEAFSLNSALAAVMTALIYTLVAEKGQTEEDEDDDAEDEDECDLNEEKEKDQPEEKPADKNEK
jgi:hypothetical protein